MITFERFEAAKIQRFINRYGKPYEFKRPLLNVFNEPAGNFNNLYVIKGVYHEASYKHLMPTIENAGTHVKTIEPMFLCMSEENSRDVKIGDVVIISEKKYEVAKIKDINDSGFAFDFSLRYIDDADEA